MSTTTGSTDTLLRPMCSLLVSTCAPNEADNPHSVQTDQTTTKDVVAEFIILFVLQLYGIFKESSNISCNIFKWFYQKMSFCPGLI